MQFDLNGTPPTIEAITAVREALGVNIPKLRRRRGAVLAVLAVLAAIAVLAVALLIDEARDGDSLTASLVAVTLIVVILGGMGSAFLAGVVTGDGWIDAPLLAATTTLDNLAPIADERCPETLGWCWDDQVLAAYQSAVARQGRMLVEGEYQAMKAWINGRGARQAQAAREAEQIAAREALRMEVAVLEEHPAMGPRG